MVFDDPLDITNFHLVCFCFMQGVCQQQNVLFDFVTVKEHLEFYSGLKEVPVEQRGDMVKLLLAYNKSLLHVKIFATCIN